MWTVKNPKNFLQTYENYTCSVKISVVQCYRVLYNGITSENLSKLVPSSPVSLGCDEQEDL